VSAIEFEKRVSESQASIENCDLDSCPRIESLTRAAMDVANEEVSEAAVVNDAVVSIVAGMSKKNKEIVKDSVLYASLRADSDFPDGGVQWYNAFKTYLGNCGWPPQSAGLSGYTVSNSRFTMEQEGLKILASAITAAALPGPTSALMLKVAKDAMDVLQSSEKPLRLFESSSKKYSGAKFAIVSAVEIDEEVVMTLGAVDFNTSINVTNVLFWEWNSSTVKIKRAESCLILNQRHFEDIAKTLREKLTENARKAVLEFDI
jgi:hypothetical protein